MTWVWRILGWLVLLVLALWIGGVVGGATYSCPDDAADCDLGILNAYAGAFVGLVLAVAVILAVEVTLLVGRRRSRRGPAPTGPSDVH